MCDFSVPLKASLSIRRRRGEAVWTLDGKTAVTPLPPAPYWLCYSTGCSYATGHIHLKSFEEEDDV